MNSKEILAANTKREELLEELRRKGVTTARGNLELRGSTEERWLSSFWDPDDRTTWVEFRDHPHLHRLYPICRPPTTGKKIYGYPVFELYYMEIKRLDPPRSEDFDMILLHSHCTRYIPLVVYKRPPEAKMENIIGRPLPLALPERLPREQYLRFYVNNPINGGPWSFCFDPMYHKLHGLKYDEVLHRVCEDEETGSQLLVSYELIQEAVKAVLVFRFIDRRRRGVECPIQILSGTISAAHARSGNHRGGDTKRVVKHFPSHKRHAVVKTNNVLPVYRRVFGVPEGSKFQVTAEDLICTTLVGGGEQGSHFTISGTLCFDVPTRTRSDHKFFTSTGSTLGLRLTVSWENACK